MVFSLIQIDISMVAPLSPPGTPLKFYGEIVRVRPLIDHNQRIGYRVIIRSTVSMTVQGRTIPIYIRTIDTSLNRRYFEWWKLWRSYYNTWKRKYASWQAHHPRGNLSQDAYQQQLQAWITREQLIPVKTAYAPVLIQGTKKDDTIYPNTKMRDIEPAEAIIWIFIRGRTQLVTVREIPAEVQSCTIDIDDPPSVIATKLHGMVL